MAISSSAPAALLLRASGLDKRFDGHEVLRGIDLDVYKGQVTVILGPSGSGKTTLLRCLNGLETADRGVLDFADGSLRIDYSRPVPRADLLKLRQKCAMVFQQFNLFAHRTALENVMEGPLIVQRRPREAVREQALRLLARVGLADRADWYPHQLSGGQQQRVGIARALAIEPELLLFDEPTSALDPELVKDVLAVIRQLADEGWSMVIVTHEMRFAREVADRVVFMENGVVVESGPPAQLFEQPQHARTREFLRRD